MTAYLRLLPPLTDEQELAGSMRRHPSNPRPAQPVRPAGPPRRLPARLDPRAGQSWTAAGWLVVGVLLAAALLYTGTQDALAAGGAR